MITLAEIIIGLICATVAMECAIGTRMVWGISKQLREREDV